ncbi:hypothetical protein CKF54_01825 [Psittacicella hinzii]|uniref:NAD kinase n=1 Tax=Psittacicella hinzii TaxID=2028575 RepID=A0A3A1Y9T8_9GAMM|nr:NAD(+)/NADH kinase [Psittacicella hinzii]RIY33980.1 hypothetical protein CKF54_01825 [Psittacicella hinzii]
MQENIFNVFAIVGEPRNPNSLITHKQIYNFLKEKGKVVLIEQGLKKQLPEIEEVAFVADEVINQRADLVICVGGDGNMIRAALRFAPHNIPLIGVNKGNLGFLTDIDPQDTSLSLERLLSPENYYIEERNTLEVSFFDEVDHKIEEKVNIFNEIALLGSRDNRILEVEVYVDKKFAFGMRGDGLIVSTPTGSTAYNLSTGGPIVHPLLHAVILTPMNAHTLTSRPVVIPATSEIDILFKKDVTAETFDIYCDGALTHASTATSHISIKSTDFSVKMVHFNDYNYYSILAKKLNWSKRLF